MEFEGESAECRRKYPLRRTAAVAREIEHLAQRLEELEAFDAAEPLWREVVAIRKAKYPDHWTYQQARRRLGANLVRLGRLEEAEGFLNDNEETVSPAWASDDTAREPSR